MNVEISTIAKLMETAVLSGKKFNVTNIETLVGYYRAEWGPLFKQQKGLTPARYIAMFRLRMICKYLRESGGSINEIISETGSCVCYTHRLFKRKFGITPKQFRNLGNLGALACIESVFGDIHFEHDLTTSPPTAK